MRRGNGDGSIFKLSGKRRNPFAVRVTIGWTEEGKQKYKYIGYYPTKTEAKKALNEYIIAPEKIKLEKFTLKNVFENMIEKSDFSDGTKQQYTSGFKCLESLHNKNIDEITLEEIEEIVDTHVISAQKRIKKTLSNCYKYAMRYEYTSKNLADFINVKTEKPKEKIPYTPQEVEKLWKYVGTARYDDIPLILLYSGLRISELLELKNENVDLENRTMNITKSKTQAGIRIVPIHDKIFPLIEKRYKQGNVHLITLNSKKMGYKQFARSYWQQEHTIHETRHSFITFLSKSTSDTIAIKKIVGHASDDITEHYTHRTLDELKEVINTLEYK